VYHTFNRTTHVAETRLDLGLPLYWAVDFNVDPMCSIVAQRVGDSIHVLDEIVLSRVSTWEACQTFWNRFSRYTGSGLGRVRGRFGQQPEDDRVERYQIMRDFFTRTAQRFIDYRVPKSNPAVRDRVLMVNAKLRSANGEVQMRVAPQCRELIRDLEEVVWRPGTTQIDKDRDPKRTHLSDAAGLFGVARDTHTGDLRRSAAQAFVRRGKLQNINVEHPDYVSRKAMWRKYRDLYVGGEQLKEHASEYLAPRQKEPADVYGERLSKVFTKLRRVDHRLVRGDSVPARTGVAHRGHIEARADILQRVHGGLRSQGNHHQRLLSQAVDRVAGIWGLLHAGGFPKCSMTVGSRAEEDLIGASRGYLVDCPAESLINWSLDDSRQLRVGGVADGVPPQERPRRAFVDKETVWRYYDRTTYRTYRRGQDRDAQVELVDEGLHALAAQRRVPLFELKVSDGLWLMNKAGLLQLEHFNKSNALSWALTMGLFATPVIYSERPWNQIVSESYYIQLAPTTGSAGPSRRVTSTRSRRRTCRAYRKRSTGCVT
jgi:hypothetical protein